MYKLLDVVILKTDEVGVLVEDYENGCFMVEIPSENSEPELRDIKTENILSLLHQEHRFR